MTNETAAARIRIAEERVTLAIEKVAVEVTRRPSAELNEAEDLLEDAAAMLEGIADSLD